MAQRQSLSILLFTDYRAFLVAHAHLMKNRNSMWSLGAWSRRLGLKATSSLTKILNGERNPGEQIVQRFIEYFGFDAESEQHFRDLISIQKLRHTPRFREALIEKVASRSPGDYARIDEATFSSLSEWYCYAIREMINLDYFNEDPDWISKQLQFRVHPTEIQKAIQKLLKAGLLKQGRTGLEPGELRIETTNDVASEAIRLYHEQALENAKKSLRAVPVNEREITATTFVLDPADIPEAKKMIRSFRKRFANTMEKMKGTQVYQMEIAFFPVTKKGEGEVT